MEYDETYLTLQPEPAPPSPLMVARELNAEAEKVQQLRRDALFSNETFMADRFTPKAEQHFLQALAHLEIAGRSLKLAALEMDLIKVT